MEKYDYLIVGSGLFGATFAYKARQAGKRCLVIDRRPHLGGNVYSPTLNPSSPLQPPPEGEASNSLPTGERLRVGELASGMGRGGAAIHVHKYGAHIFHTSNKEVWDFVNSLVPFNRYTNSPIANYHGELYNLPFNMNTFNRLWGVKTPEEAKRKLEEQRAEAVAALAGREPANLEEQALTLVGKDVFEKLIKEYTEKQWGRKCTELPAFIIKRLPVRLTYDNNYFNDKYQGIPIGGYNKLIEGLLSPTAPLNPPRRGTLNSLPTGERLRVGELASGMGWGEAGCIETLCGIDVPLSSNNKVKNVGKRLRETANCANYDLLKENAKQMRKEPTEAEAAFWELVSGNGLDVKFRRQHIIGDYIVDFVCLEKNLVVEIDGGYHDDEQQQIDDNLRSKELKDYGFTILRLQNEEVIAAPQEVIRKVRLALWLAEKAPLREGFGEACHKLVYTGPLDEYFGYSLGKLDWRTVTFKTRVENIPNFQGNAVVNYTSHDVPYTRVIEHKHFEMFGQEVYDCPFTVISEEYSTEYREGMEPYYPVNDERNNALAAQYKELAHQEGVMFPEEASPRPSPEGRELKASPTGGGMEGASSPSGGGMEGASGEGRGGAVIFGGRLAQYKYYDMAPIIEQALSLF